MKIKSNFLDDMILNSKIMMLVRHLEYSLRDVKSYEDLTSEEKTIISKEVFHEYFQEGRDPLISHEIKFHPWVGENYHCGVKGFDKNGKIVYGTPDNPGLKILLLDDHHYFEDSTEVTSTATQDLIKDLIDPNSEWKPFKIPYTNFIKYFTGYTDNLEFDDKKDAWDHLAFYKYIQNPVIKKLEPRDIDYALSELAFWKTINDLKPDLMIVWGYKLYLNLPEGERLDDLKVKDDYGDNIYVEHWSYKLDNRIIPFIDIQRSVGGYNAKFCNEIIKKFISKTLRLKDGKIKKLKS